MVLRVSKASEWLAPRQVADNVKGDPIVPRHHIYWKVAPFAILVQTLKKQADVGGNQRLLVGYGLQRKPMR